ncbi:hypothetical protein [Nocardia sp. NPDC005366]|uniref:TY-Chap domain-containing protein n=1 Tax=Nocardia sp. NPDC005366 TaxID=3156878 RepID=UPI0033AA1796
MTGWDAFAAGLADELSTAPDTSVIVIGEAVPAASWRFVQFRKDEGALWAELTADRWLEPGSCPDEAGRAAISRAGWHPPDGVDTFNRWVEFAWPVTTGNYRQAAAMAVAGLRDGFGIAKPDDLSYEAWVERSGNHRLLLPSLGVREKT